MARFTDFCETPARQQTLWWLNVAFSSKYCSLQQRSKTWCSFTNTVCIKKTSAFKSDGSWESWSESKRIRGCAMYEEWRHHTSKRATPVPVPSDQTPLDGIHALALSLQAPLPHWELCPLAGLKIKETQEGFQGLYVSIFPLFLPPLLSPWWFSFSNM